jgi:uncharacterized membrane protein YpjA
MNRECLREADLARFHKLKPEAQIILLAHYKVLAVYKGFRYYSLQSVNKLAQFKIFAMLIPTACFSFIVYLRSGIMTPRSGIKRMKSTIEYQWVRW